MASEEDESGVVLQLLRPRLVYTIGYGGAGAPESLPPRGISHTARKVVHFVSQPQGH